MRFTFTLKEGGNLLLSSLILGFLFSLQNIYLFPAMSLIVGIAFVTHELSHKFVAEHYDCKAEYVLWPQGILFSLIMGFLSGGNFIFAAIGYVSISNYYATRLGYHWTHLSLEETGKISAAGPLSNVVLGIIFSMFPNNPFMAFGSFLNSTLALFNLMPFPPLDGSKVFAWSRIAWASITAGAGAIFGLSLLINPIIAGIIGLIVMVIMLFYMFYKEY